MADKDLTVVVFGVTNSGKSTVAYEVARFLRQRGLNVEVDDPDSPSSDQWEDQQVLRLEALRARGTRVLVRSMVQRTTPAEPAQEPA